MFTQIAMQYDLSIHQMDVKAAFLNAPIDCEIYVEQPPGFKQKNKKGGTQTEKEPLWFKTIR